MQKEVKKFREWPAVVKHFETRHVMVQRDTNIFRMANNVDVLARSLSFFGLGHHGICPGQRRKILKVSDDIIERFCVFHHKFCISASGLIQLETRLATITLT